MKPIRISLSLEARGLNLTGELSGDIADQSSPWFDAFLISFREMGFRVEVTNDEQKPTQFNGDQLHRLSVTPEEQKNDQSRLATASAGDSPADPRADVLRLVETALDRIDSESFMVDYTQIGRGSGGLGCVVERSTVLHALLFVKQALTGSVSVPAQEHAAERAGAQRDDPPDTSTL